MNDTEKLRYMDFISIAIEQLELENPDIAIEFIDDVRIHVLNANREQLSDKLQNAIDVADAGNYYDAIEILNDVYSELME